MPAENSENTVQFPRPHVRKLMRVARKQGRSRGHELGRWRSYDHWPWVRDASCIVCEAEVRIETKALDTQKLLDHSMAKGVFDVLQESAERFLTNEPSVDGTALLYPCPFDTKSVEGLGSIENQIAELERWIDRQPTNDA